MLSTCIRITKPRFIDPQDHWTVQVADALQTPALVTSTALPAFRWHQNAKAVDLLENKNIAALLMIDLIFTQDLLIHTASSAAYFAGVAIKATAYLGGWL